MYRGQGGGEKPERNPTGGRCALRGKNERGVKKGEGRVLKWMNCCIRIGKE